MLTIAYLKGYMRFGSYIEPNAFSLFTVVNIQGHTKKITLPISTSECNPVKGHFAISTFSTM